MKISDRLRDPECFNAARSIDRLHDGPGVYAIGFCNWETGQVELYISSTVHIRNSVKAYASNEFTESWLLARSTSHAIDTYQAHVYRRMSLKEQEAARQMSELHIKSNSIYMQLMALPSDVELADLERYETIWLNAAQPVLNESLAATE